MSTLYLVYRTGTNSANQSLRTVAPVALVEADSRSAACETTWLGSEPSVDHCPVLALATYVTVWAGQTLHAVPASRAPRADVREVQELE